MKTKTPPALFLYVALIVNWASFLYAQQVAPPPMLWLQFNGSFTDSSSISTASPPHDVYGVLNATFANDVPNATLGTNSLFLPGNGSYVEVDNVSDLNFNTGNPFSVSSWVKTTNGGLIWAKSTAAADKKGNEHTVACFIGTSNTVDTADNGDGEPVGSVVVDVFYVGDVVSVATNLNDGNWHHVVVTYTANNTWSLYIDGEFDQSASFDACNEGANDEGPWSFTVGATLNSHFPTETGKGDPYGPGEIDEVGVWNFTLSADQVASVYTNGIPSQSIEITQQPMSTNLVSGGVASLSVAGTPVNISGTLSYQWESNGVAIVGATSATYTTPVLTSSAVYTCLLTVSSVTVSSGEAIVSVPQNPMLPVIPTNIYYITNYGASTNLSAVQSAIDAASDAGGGIVWVTAGNFVQNPFTFASNINLYLDAGATLTMPSLSQYPGGDTSPSDFITGSGLHDVEISGMGVINGQGLPWWNDASTNSSAARPVMIYLSNCNRVLIQNATFTNSPHENIIVQGASENVTIQDIHIYAPESSPNTDGIDITATDALITGCTIFNGDDCVALKGGDSPTSDILVTNCAFNNGHGVSVGSETASGISNFTVINCTFTNTQYGIRFKSDRTEGGLAQDLTYLNLQMTDIYSGCPILLYSYYDVYTPGQASPSTAASDPAQAVTSTTPIWRNITISNVIATTTGVSPPILIWGLPEMLISNVALIDVNISGQESCGIYNATSIQFINSQITLPNGDTTFELYDAQLTVTNSTPSSQLVTFNGLTTNSIGNQLTLYNVRAALSNTNAIGEGPITLGGTTLTISNNLTLPAPTVVNFTLSTNPTEVVVTSNLTLNSTLNIADGGGFGAGTYTLFAYDGKLSGNPVLGKTPMLPGYTYSITNPPGHVQLLVQFTAPPSPPSFGRINASASGLVISGSGGTTNSTFYILTSTNIALPINQWTPFATNLFDGSGNFIFTNAINPNTPQMFYLIKD